MGDKQKNLIVKTTMVCIILGGLVCTIPIMIQKLQVASINRQINRAQMQLVLDAETISGAQALINDTKSNIAKEQNRITSLKNRLNEFHPAILGTQTVSAKEIEIPVATTDDNLISVKPVERWRLNSSGYSQRYIALTGVDRTERMIELLGHYGFTSEQYDAIKTIARIHRVYPEMIICIAYADSSLGKFLKTDNNFGNVGNNDRGDKVAYSNFEAGMNAIAKVLNNKYLGDYISVDQLSWAHNPGATVYATSTENRHINVTNCLGMIRNKRVPDNFAFRF